MVAESITSQVPGTFAYNTVKDRWPKILTKIIDQLHRRYAEVKSLLGQDGADELTTVLNNIAEMKYRMVTNKELIKFDESSPNATYWNDKIEKLEKSKQNFWFEGEWLFIECYMYRRLHEFLSKTKHIKDIDMFMFEKDEALGAAIPCMEKIASNLDQYNQREMLLISLWANKYDLSLSGGDATLASTYFLDHLKEWDGNVLCDDSRKLFYYYSEAMPMRRIDIVADNGGLEFFADLCLAVKFLKHNTAQSVKFHLKPYPWFVSDITVRDAFSMINFLNTNSSRCLKELGLVVEQLIKEDKLSFCDHEFWNLGAPYNEMKEIATDLYEDLKNNSNLVIFKGDLNYRKLVGDKTWEPTTPFKESLSGFDVSPLLALRTLKAETVAGLDESTYTKMQSESDWMISGNFGLIQFIPPQ